PAPYAGAPLASQPSTCDVCSRPSPADSAYHLLLSLCSQWDSLPAERSPPCACCRPAHNNRRGDRRSACRTDTRAIHTCGDSVLHSRRAPCVVACSAPDRVLCLHLDRRERLALTHVCLGLLGIEVILPRLCRTLSEHKCQDRQWLLEGALLAG